MTAKKRQVNRVCSEAMKTDWVSYYFLKKWDRGGHSALLFLSKFEYWAM